ncbi:hypothetical protein GTP44_09440 [Duganella sp. FT50W]|uniref:Peptidase n=1 Tax=Duganella lactea TaxID=2692173 RepID=A0A6L8MGX3_9BURK|nr:hypothetical protein [Duganella lactea]MYM35577.1 hypothetical protein [Duganella lactea]MYM82173.1 hypothetical protein [Duganella lactea]
MIKRAFLSLLLLSSGLASAAELTELEIRWLKAGADVLHYAKQVLQLPLDITVQPQARANDVPLALGYDQGRCKLVLSLRGNPHAEDLLDSVPAAQRGWMIEAMVAHEIGHCWRYAQGHWHALPAGFAERPPAAGAAADLRDTRREEGFADLVALAWVHQRQPQHYATVAAWLHTVRFGAPAVGSHSTLTWLRLAPTGAAFTTDLPVVEQATLLWRQGLLNDE